MTQLENNLKILNELDSHWLETVSNEMKKENGTTTPELVKAYNRLWRTLRAAFKEDKELALEIFQNNTEGDGTWLLKDIENSLKIYFSFSCLRKIQEKQSEQVKTVLDYVFENAILYYDPQFMNEYEKYNCKSKIDFLNVAKALNALVSFYLNRHFSSKNMLKDLEEETGLNAELCSYIVNIIMEDYQKLQLNFIIDSLQELQNR